MAADWREIRLKLCCPECGRPFRCDKLDLARNRVIICPNCGHQFNCNAPYQPGAAPSP